jgi:hypothetical protein
MLPVFISDRAQSGKKCRQGRFVADNLGRRKKKKKQAKCYAEHTEVDFANPE